MSRSASARFRSVSSWRSASSALTRLSWFVSERIIERRSAICMIIATTHTPITETG